MSFMKILRPILILYLQVFKKYSVKTLDDKLFSKQGHQGTYLVIFILAAVSFLLLLPCGISACFMNINK